MTINVCKVKSATEAIQLLEELVLKGGANLFRRHRDSNWRLESTFARHRRVPFTPSHALDIDGMNMQFITRLRAMDISVPFLLDNRRAALEFGRHYGMPSPLIDFSKSPYPALFFAFDGVVPSRAKDDEFAAIYCLNRHEIAAVWALNNSKNLDGKIDGKAHINAYEEFMHKDDDFFSKGYIPGKLKYIELPASWNRRMVRQMGCFLYDTLAYPFGKVADLEDYLSQDESPSDADPKNVMLTKVLIPPSVGREVFERLDLVGINGTFLFDSHEGAVKDVVNSYNYGRRSGFAWDIRM